ncbi:FecR family protein [Arsenicibacter rosenii]|uniref:Iron dicitrate transport regulator FecR n=1 Tax=Arsenicibacter rosenii TaxID=1750698 RepID=A0A1S2VEL4_9BACT|nr:FecR domain-containing protein [Arsenicibacter rosenii]OIN56636.1 hypothetical protein BLX24_23690 [Arsenicibacter rosenii]
MHIGMDFQYDTVTDFVKDPSFQKWVIDPDADTAAFWEGWLAANPAQRTTLLEARQLILDLRFTTDYAANRAMIDVWQQIQAGKAALPVIRPLRYRQRSTFLIAAAISGLLLLTYATYQYYTRSESITTISTHYGETRTLSLPDGSVVTLNANSHLSFPTSWDTGKPREVWLEGEAYFRVQEKKGTGQARFSVHAEPVTVEVVGTVFNVKHRKKQARVVLESGKVNLLVQQPGQRRQHVFMKPGELADVDTRATVRVCSVDPAAYTSWQSNQLVFRKTALREIATQLEETYGYSVTFTDPDVADKRFSGSVPSQQPELLLMTLSKLYNLNISKQNNQVIISTKHL